MPKYVFLTNSTKNWKKKQVYGQKSKISFLYPPPGDLLNFLNLEGLGLNIISGDFGIGENFGSKKGRNMGFP